MYLCLKAQKTTILCLYAVAITTACLFSTRTTTQLCIYGKRLYVVVKLLELCFCKLNREGQRGVQVYYTGSNSTSRIPCGEFTMKFRLPERTGSKCLSVQPSFTSQSTITCCNVQYTCQGPHPVCTHGCAWSCLRRPRSHRVIDSGL